MEQIEKLKNIDNENALLAIHTYTIAAFCLRYMDEGLYKVPFG